MHAASFQPAIQHMSLAHSMQPRKHLSLPMHAQLFGEPLGEEEDEQQEEEEEGEEEGEEGEGEEGEL